MDITNAIDRTNLEDYAGAKLKSMLDFIEQQKSEGREGVHYPWYIPSNRMKHLDGFKNFIFEGLIAKGNYVTDFLPGAKQEIGGFMKDVFICWTEQAKLNAESEGLIFKTY
ncbi:MAG: hypothetical protein ABIN80_02895 [Dyadobacter sp.]|uniref:hypothetical protein n=1 Tax=Dyadobacter sp. TaxID=1914288 RepID=UPI003265C3CC